MNSVRRRALAGELLAGVWCNMGSTTTIEIAAQTGFDWLLIDLEHGAADQDSLVFQMQTTGGYDIAPFVRIAWNELPRFKRVLDLGVSGVMVPYINTREEAEQAVSSVRYPPQGKRGVSNLNRATDYGTNFLDYFARANSDITTITQIETSEAIDNCEEIASVDGADVLFVGPLDLSVSLGIPHQFESDRFKDALKIVAASAKKHGKGAGILLGSTALLEYVVGLGFNFIALGSDTGMVSSGMRANFEMLNALRK